MSVGDGGVTAVTDVGSYRGTCDGGFDRYTGTGCDNRADADAKADSHTGTDCHTGTDGNGDPEIDSHTGTDCNTKTDRNTEANGDTERVVTGDREAVTECCRA